ncbi:MAG: hypothetical protein BAJATHORv1_40113 [Candidatus Thorarchaeota archaeon]|nr:MAG: hypothetical protein BAJATHORv1_40113 [Candidatus Thorarchaeota archaeon]
MSSKSTLVTSLVIVVVVFAGIGAALFIANPYEPSRVAVVAMEPGFGDLSMADQVQEGLDNLSLDVSVTYVGFDTTPADADQLLTELAQSGEYVLILAVGNKFETSVESVATQYPDQHFALINGDVDLANVVSVDFLVEQGSYLAGVLAAFLASERLGYGIVGVLAAVDDDKKITALVDGFRLGVLEANETYDLNITLLDTEYVGYYDNDDVAGNMTVDLFEDDNVTVLFTPVRASMHGIRTGLEAVNDTFYERVEDEIEDEVRRPYVIAAEYNLDYFGTADPQQPVDPSWVVTSVVVHSDWATYDILYETLWNRFPGGEHNIYGLADGWVNLTRFRYSSTYISDESMQAVKEYREYIIANNSFPEFL